jgi:hypothetical protein
LPQGEDDLRLREFLLHPELLSECPILLEKLHPEWTKIRGSGQAEPGPGLVPRPGVVYNPSGVNQPCA